MDDHATAELLVKLIINSNFPSASDSLNFCKL